MATRKIAAGGAIDHQAAIIGSALGVTGVSGEGAALQSAVHGSAAVAAGRAVAGDEAIIQLAAIGAAAVTNAGSNHRCAGGLVAD